MVSFPHTLKARFYNVVVKIGEKDKSRVATALIFYFQSAPKNCTYAEWMINFPRTIREPKTTEKYLITRQSWINQHTIKREN